MFIRLTWFVLALFSSIALAVPEPVVETSDPKSFISDVSKIYRASMYHIFKSQTLINQRGGDKSALFGQAFIENIKRTYKTKFKQPFPAENRRLHTLLLRSMMDVMEDNRTLLGDTDLGFKGLIPATFAFQLSEILSRKGHGVKIKFTNMPDKVRNPINLPDPWEVAVMEQFQQSKIQSYFDDTSTLDGVPAYRHFVPLPMNRFCLNCHGEPQDNPLNTGKDKAQWTHVDMSGFEMEHWKLGDFGGGVSVTIYKKDFLELEELCEHNYISTFVCHFFALE